MFKYLLGIIIIEATVFVFLVLKPLVFVANVNPIPDTQTEVLNGDIIFNNINKWRITQSLPEFTKSDRLCESAKLRLEEVKRDWSHSGFDADRFCNDKWCKLGENLGKDIKTNQGIVDSWVRSPSHLEILKDNFDFVCVEVSGRFVVAHFGSF